MRLRLLTTVGLGLALVAGGGQMGTVHAAPARPALSPVSPGSGPDYSVFAKSQNCFNVACTSGTKGEVLIYYFGTAAFAVPNVVYGYCETFSGSGYRLARFYGFSASYYGGGTISGFAGAIGPSSTGTSQGFAFGVHGTPGIYSYFEGYYYNPGTVTGADTANNNSEAITAGGFEATTTGVITDQNGNTSTGTLSCRVGPGGVGPDSYADGVNNQHFQGS